MVAQGDSCGCGVQTGAMSNTTHIKNATIYDSSGAAPASGDVLVDGDRITVIEM
jgi:hypothetical protein